MRVLDAENQLQLDDDNLNTRIGLLEVKLLESEQVLKPLKDSEKRYRRLFESAQDGILILDADTGRVVDANPFLLHLLGYSYSAMYGQFIWEIGVFKDIAASKDAFQTLQQNEYIRYEDLPLETSQGHPIAVEFVSNVYLVDQHKVIQCNIRDITARKRDEAERKKLQAAIEQSAEIIVMTDAQGKIQFVNPSYERATGYSREEVIGQNQCILNNGMQDEAYYRTLWETISDGRTWEGRLDNKRKDGTFYTEESSISPVRDASNRIINYVSVSRDITEQLRLAEQYQQAQKMEAVGLLAGGVAHDFNNMLAVIIGYTELALHRADLDPSLRSNLDEVVNAARRSADITRQLLTFARKQPTAPVVLNLHKAVEGILKMLRRLIGEDVVLAWLPGEGPCSVMIDPTQVDQILANLCVNARDAIADIGRITIETGNAIFDEAYCSQNAGFVSGEFVKLSISDDGCGMGKDVIHHIFDPFFTSKGVGEGTGLGLSMVYGIVKQNNGFINVYSEPGNGTTFSIYLPLVTDNAVNKLPENAVEDPKGNYETVLVVEDEPALLALSKLMLEQMGYRVLTAGTPEEAMTLAREHAADLQLLITDVVMPEMNGKELSKRLKALFPHIKILFMSGYTANVITKRGGLDESVNFIQKPFSMQNLAAKVSEVLNESR